MAAKSGVVVSDTNAISVLQYLVKTLLETLSVIRYVVSRHRGRYAKEIYEIYVVRLKSHTFP